MQDTCSSAVADAQECGKVSQRPLKSLFLLLRRMVKTDAPERRHLAAAVALKYGAGVDEQL